MAIQGCRVRPPAFSHIAVTGALILSLPDWFYWQVTHIGQIVAGSLLSAQGLHGAWENVIGHYADRGHDYGSIQRVAIVGGIVAFGVAAITLDFFWAISAPSKRRAYTLAVGILAPVSIGYIFVDGNWMRSSALLAATLYVLTLVPSQRVLRSAPD